MAERVCLIDLPGMSRELLAHVPPDTALGQWLARHPIAALQPTQPAVTCSVQASLTTGTPPSRHGIVSNGIATYRSSEDQGLVDPSNYADYRRQVSFWEQSNQLLQTRRFWQDQSGQSRWKTAMLFFQNAMPGFAEPLKPAADIVITPKPEHGPDGKITSLLWTEPRDLQQRLFAELGPFPLMHYWGPMAGIQASEWIVRSATWVWQHLQPQLQLVYVPHLDYDLQRFGPSSDQAKQAVVAVSRALTPLMERLIADGAAIVLLSEYAMQDVSRCMQPNRLLAENGLLRTRPTADGALVDYAASDAFAMADHQVAHVYVRNEAVRQRARAVLEAAGVRVLGQEEMKADRLDHRRSGDLLAVAPEGAWLDYRWWSDPADAPAFATTVDIHRKPGYDALEVFFDPAIKGISQDTTRLKGSHGWARGAEAVIAGDGVSADAYDATEVAVLLRGLVED